MKKQNLVERMLSSEEMKKERIAHLVEFYLEDLGLWSQLWPKDRLYVNHNILENYINSHIVNAIQARMDLLWSWGRNCAISPTSDRTIYLEVRGGHGLEGSLRKNKIPTFIIKELNALQTCGVKIVLIPLAWFWTDSESEDSAHSTLLVVDTVTQTYQLFDPNEGDMDVFDITMPNNTLDLNRYDIITKSKKGKALIPGYKPGPLVMQPLPSIQTTIERTDSKKRKRVVPSGLCAVITTLVLVFCRRFQYGNPWDLATAIRDQVTRIPNKSQLEMFRINISNWYRHLYTAKSWPELEQRVGLLNPIERKNRQCLVLYNLGIGSLECIMDPCPGHAYCSYHRHALLMARWHNKENGKCSDPIDWKYNGTPPLGNPKPELKEVIWV
jgi:hypothetical protein